MGLHDMHRFTPKQTDEILLTDVILCSGCHHDDHAEGRCAAPTSLALAAVFESTTCMCGRRLTGSKAAGVNSPPTGGIIGDHPTIRGDRR